MMGYTILGRIKRSLFIGRGALLKARVFLTCPTGQRRGRCHLDVPSNSTRLLFVGSILVIVMELTNI